MQGEGEEVQEAGEEVQEARGAGGGDKVEELWGKWGGAEVCGRQGRKWRRAQWQTMSLLICQILLRCQILHVELVQGLP